MTEWVRLTEIGDRRARDIDVRVSAITLIKPGSPAGSRVFVLGVTGSQVVVETPEEIRRLLGMKE